jgi:hypothetical protein
MNLVKRWLKAGLAADHAAATKSLLEYQRRGESISHNLLLQRALGRA